MEFTFTLAHSGCNGYSLAKYHRTPEQEALARANHAHMESLAIDPPITIGSPKQIKWAKAIASKFLFHAHSWAFSATDIDLVFANNGKYAKFWIDNRNPSGNSGEGVTRIAVDRELAKLRAIAEADRAANVAIAQLTPAQLAKKIGRL